MSDVDEILALFRSRGDSEYGGEQVTQQEHALQCALLAETEHASPALIVASLLHDIGHLLHDLPQEAPEQGIDDHHETSAAAWLRKRFPESVTEPVRLHVAAKRYLCAVDAKYRDQLSLPLVTSLRLQGGPMSPQEVEQFEQNPFAGDAVQLRRWDDEAKIPALATPPLSHFTSYLEQVVVKGGAE
ncbi:MAG: HD domain-containing protein [Planctomycetaceae bacterium]|nr:HD domain-containing protein [Planctomycetaceae bacterium]